ncbi:glycine betaine/proline transport system substrate-binding protein [Evansella vedderi]|uniref:Glycine betaine/proline transport system substrate-binding protein n=1 Tax=Evansella vedderi TaxID=38282 RepID=A0ABT9ZXZ6_9BACI|nr:glycine betaine ABC transporter substrate-binding protein [Evansella vedderi]MDQ0256113.1 glycine betaine/proline transport system substrate-binding protein [Evansella vedderi]
MLRLNWKRLGLAAVLSLSLFTAACGSDDASTDSKEIELVYVEWDSEIASTHVIGKVFEDQGYDVTLTPIDNSLMWGAVASGEADGMVAAWLPATHAGQYEEYGGSVVELGANLEGAKIGLVVPSYMNVDSIADLDAYADELRETITGIEAGAGVVTAAEAAVDTDYPNLAGWEVLPSSSGAMATALGEAIANEEPIVVTGWTPHWKFASYDLKYLEDPEGTFGDAEYIATMVREGLEEDDAVAFTILDQFNWTAADMEAVMLDIQEGASPEEAASAWVEANQDKVNEWIAGIE